MLRQAGARCQQETPPLEWAMRFAIRRPGWTLPPQLVAAAALVIGVGMIGASVGLMHGAARPAADPGAARDWAGYDGIIQLVRQCPDGAAIYRRGDGRWFVWNQWWTERPSAGRPDAC
jgi:hypothetical protein